jgi:putative transposase
VPRLRRIYGLGHLHFITFSCYRRLRFLGAARRRDLFLHILEQVRRRYRFVVVGYVVMPEHVHLLVSEPERGNPGTVVQALKQRVARAVLRELRHSNVAEQGILRQEAGTEAHVWQARFYDFVVYTRNNRG